MKLSADIMEPTVIDGVIEAASVVNINSSYVVELAELFTGWVDASGLTGAPNSTLTFSVSTTSNLQEEWNMRNSYTFIELVSSFIILQLPQVRYVTICRYGQCCFQNCSWPSTSNTVGANGVFQCSDTLLEAIYDTTVNNYRGITVGEIKLWIVNIRSVVATVEMSHLL